MEKMEERWSIDARNGDHTSRLAGYGYRAGKSLARDRLY
jgi:hypothetical protein